VIAQAVSPANAMRDVRVMTGSLAL